MLSCPSITFLTGIFIFLIDHLMVVGTLGDLRADTKKLIRLAATSPSAYIHLIVE